MDTKPSFIEHHIPREPGRVYAREYAGTDPAFVLMHGFPDNLQIYDQLIPHLVAAGRRVVTFDFLGFGASDKPAGAKYSFKQQQNDLEAVVEALHLDKIVPVGHDAGGPAAINFALDHPDRVTALCMLNSFYAAAPTIQRNEVFAASRFSTGLKIIPSMKAMIIGCVDPRVDPADIFGLAPGEAAVIRNVGGRITPATLQTMAMLRIVARATGA